jgi:D-apionolactonase
VSATAPAGGLSRYELWYGRAQEPAQCSRLSAGALEVELEGPEIRSVQLGGVELLRGMYMALRDELWGTVAGEISAHEVRRGDGGFTVELEMSHRQAPVAYAWRGRIAGAPSGELSYEMDGVAESAFRYCRIGFCLLHPLHECAGQPYRGLGPSGPVEGRLPLEIAPQLYERGIYWPLFASVSELELELASGVTLEMTFEGDLFETEDQRNWTDASFKTYCTPQALGYPFDAAAGQRFRQKVTLRASVAAPAPTAPLAAPAPAPPRPARPAVYAVELAGDPALPRPPIGLALPRELDRHSEAELGLLRHVRPSHLRVDVALDAGAWSQRLAAAGDTARELGCPLEVAAFASDEHQVGVLIERLAGLPVERLLLLARGEEMTDPSLTRHARELIARRELSIPVAGGTDLWFAELNRARPDVTAMDALVYSITPQVHAFDERSIAQSLEAQPATVRTGAAFAGGLPLIVSMVSLRPRDLVEASQFAPLAAPPESLPSSVDPRQASLFAAAWTVGSIAALAGAGAASLTCFETAGWRGIVPGDRPPPAGFAGPPAGGAYAVFHALADVLELGAGTELVAVDSGGPAELAVLALAAGAGLRVLVANVSPEPVGVEVGPFPAGAVRLRVLDETTAGAALFEPLAYRSLPATSLTPRAGTVPLELKPFAVARIDAERR